MLQLLKETVSSRHSERLEQIVIALIGIEIGGYSPSFASLLRALISHPAQVLGIVTILVDLFA